MAAEQAKQNPSFDPNRYWDEKIVAAYLRLSREWLQQDRSRQPPRIPFSRLGRAIRYHPDDVKRYAESCKVAART